MPIIVEKVASQPVYNSDGERQEIFVQVRFFHKGRPYSVLSIHSDEFDKIPQPGDEVKLALSRHAGQ